MSKILFLYYHSSSYNSVSVCILLPDSYQFLFGKWKL